MSKYTYFEESARDIAKEMSELLILKQKDYGPKNITQCPVGAEMGVLVRVYDKLSRLSNLLESGETPNNESLEDTWRDIVGYGLIGLMLHRGEFKLPMTPQEAANAKSKYWSKKSI